MKNLVSEYRIWKYLSMTGRAESGKMERKEAESHLETSEYSQRQKNVFLLVWKQENIRTAV